MLKRTSIVDKINISSVAFSSIFQVGDSKEITPTSSALAVQRVYELFFGSEGNLEEYPAFTKPIPKSTIDEYVNVNYSYKKPVIKVHCLDITGVSNAAIAQIGSTKKIKTEARVKHIRQIADRD